MTSFFFFFFNDTATTEIYTLSLHDALPILTPGAFVLNRGDRCRSAARGDVDHGFGEGSRGLLRRVVPNTPLEEDRKRTRLNSSHANISYAVFCLKKKNRNTT